MAKPPEVQRCVVCGEEWIDMPGAPMHRCVEPPPPPPTQGTPYTNRGKGLVLNSDSTTAKVAALFDERAYWTSAELNARVGWQFSQAIYALRRKGMRIVTKRIGPRAFAYQRVAA